MGFQTGEIVGVWRLGERLGGRFGEVRRAVRADDPSAAAVLKLAETPEQSALLARELQVASRVSHPRLLRPASSHLSGRPAYLVLPHVPGGSLRGRLTEYGPLSADKAARVLADVLEALAALHAAGLCHGDLKPENVLLDADLRPVLCDFGLSVEWAATGPARLPAPGGRPGTWHYMSPELRAGAAAPGPADDVYAAGLLLFEMLTRRLLRGPVDLRETAVPLWARQVVEAAAGPASERPPDAGALRELLGSLYNLEGPGAAPWVRPPMPAGPTSGPLPRPVSSAVKLRTRRHQAGLPVGRYVLAARIGEDRFTDAWQALPAEGPGPAVAVKFLGDPQFVNNLRHARLEVPTVSHPNLTALLELHLDTDTPHAVCEFVAGRSLRERLLEGAVPVGEAASILDGILSGLAAAHAGGLAHRNLRPENVILAESDGRAVVTDLGLGGAVEETTCQMCMSGLDWAEFAEHWRYLSPEQEQAQTGRPSCDVFAAGLMFHEMLIGCLPPAVLRDSAVAGLPEKWRPLVERALAPAPARFRDAAEFLAALRSTG
jgi:serine/threonine-protein kinase